MDRVWIRCVVVLGAEAGRGSTSRPLADRALRPYSACCICRLHTHSERSSRTHSEPSACGVQRRARRRTWLLLCFPICRRRRTWSTTAYLKSSAVWTRQNHYTVSHCSIRAQRKVARHRLRQQMLSRGGCFGCSSRMACLSVEPLNTCHLATKAAGCLVRPSRF